MDNQIQSAFKKEKRIKKISCHSSIHERKNSCHCHNKKVAKHSKLTNKIETKVYGRETRREASRIAGGLSPAAKLERTGVKRMKKHAGINDYLSKSIARQFQQSMSH